MNAIDLSGYKVTSGGLMTASNWNGLFGTIVQAFADAKSEMSELADVTVLEDYPDVANGDAITATDWYDLMDDLRAALYDCCMATHASYWSEAYDGFFISMMSKGSGGIIYESNWNDLVDTTQYVINEVTSEHRNN